ncbi:hypothetical protein PVAP13_4KG167403 [Panicum virgatum]|uniref:Uncharacterized protein n=1 Tax=Panicum virgatum TaxID=38727 RepID=A0A8T0TFV8_PANVG|nr:hypothetical protein PVAP13_4KG167403 [Panicum virgatum]KAG2610703.1 hypothetical protein PVAP13_4KG167403 [Panicum virgatum]KAG2610704.1 hypothetical protein PVAP13_4KG167403 [Panicum virgatum]KAG2610705.1 hypothetical protein PVAP13_4KG167403 [Panicum virgatum]
MHGGSSAKLKLQRGCFRSWYEDGRQTDEHVKTFVFSTCRGSFYCRISSPLAYLKMPLSNSQDSGCIIGICS